MTRYSTGIVVGSLVAGLTLLSTAAMAGQGVGGTVNLGRINKVTKQTSIVAATTGRTLQLSNTGSGAALGLKVKAGQAPMTVNSGTKVTKLNSDQVDGYSADELARQVSGGSNNTWSALGLTSKAQVTMTAPRPGYVLVQGQLTTFPFSTCSDNCGTHADIRHVESDTNSYDYFTSAANGSSTQSSISLSWVFPVTAGPQTFELRAAPTGTPNPFIGNPHLTAVFVPFNSVGSSTDPATATPVAPKGPIHNGVIIRR